MQQFPAAIKLSACVILTSRCKQTKTASSTVPESPTTARPLDLDDDDVQESGIITSDDKPGENMRPASGEPAGTEDTPPTKPPRPMTEAQKNELILKEAFPGIDESVIKAVLSASRGHIEPAFQALLGEAGLQRRTLWTAS